MIAHLKRHYGFNAEEYIYIYIVTFENLVNTLFVFCTILVSIFFVTSAQAQNFEWVKRFGGVGTDLGTQIKQNNGSLYSTASFTGSVGFDSYLFNGLVNNTNTAVLKLDKSGVVKVARHLKSPIFNSGEL